MRKEMILFCIFICLHYCSCEDISPEAFTTYVTSRKVSLESYITSGDEEGRKHCDILNVSPITYNMIPDTPQFVTDMKTLKTLDLKTSLSNANCLIVVAQVNDAGTLSHLIKFGLKASQ